MDLSFVEDSLKTFSKAVKAVKDVFEGFAQAFDTIAGLAIADKPKFAETGAFDLMSSKGDSTK